MPLEPPPRLLGKSAASTRLVLTCLAFPQLFNLCGFHPIHYIHSEPIMEPILKFESSRPQPTRAPIHLLKILWNVLLLWQSQGYLVVSVDAPVPSSTVKVQLPFRIHNENVKGS